ncbi:unnamed protein product [Rhizoctonia solani]|uniref:Uncharacterized protein n=1 Tax=Rhizoctonia solani TaxID=456999 RepID=A0A8H3CNY9_9AGAM|nr:unnamed protein product [Rhizoctonia solani]
MGLCCITLSLVSGSRDTPPTSSSPGIAPPGPKSEPGIPSPQTIRITHPHSVLFRTPLHGPNGLYFTPCRATSIALVINVHNRFVFASRIAYNSHIYAHTFGRFQLNLYREAYSLMGRFQRTLRFEFPFRLSSALSPNPDPVMPLPE